MLAVRFRRAVTALQRAALTARFDSAGPQYASSFASVAIRYFCSAAAPPALPPGTCVVPMPQLSPSMTHGSVAKWLKVRARALQGLAFASEQVKMSSAATILLLCKSELSSRPQGSLWRSLMWSWRSLRTA